MVSLVPSAAERLIARRYVRTGGDRGFVSLIATFSLIGVALGVAALIVVLSVMGGFRSQLIARLAGISGHIVVMPKSGLLSDAPAIAGRIATIPFISSSTPVLEAQALATGNGRASAVVLKGVTPQSMHLLATRSLTLVFGDASAFSERTGVVMGERLRQYLGLRPGDVLQVISYRRAENGTSVPKPIDYEVLASFTSGRSEIDSTTVYVPIDLLQEDLELPAGAASKIEIAIPDPTRVAAFSGLILQRLERDDLRLQDWRQINARYVGALEIERTMMFIILTLIIVVAIMNIIASFTMLVVNKSRGIAILRTMGATRAGLMRTFFLAGSSVGLVGTAIGAALGIGIALNMSRIAGALSRATGGGSAEIEFINQMPARIDIGEVAAILGIAVILSIAAAIYPALRAARLDPVEALRHG